MNMLRGCQPTSDTTYEIHRMFRDHYGKNYTVAKGLTLKEARAHCSDPETSSSTCTTTAGENRTAANGPWFDGYSEE